MCDRVPELIGFYKSHDIDFKALYQRIHVVTVNHLME